MQALQSYQFVELSQSELINISGGGEFECLCDFVPGSLSASLALGGQDFTLTPNDYVLKVTDEGVSVCITGFLGLNIPLPAGPLWKL
ncbi:pepsin-like aspartyl protease [Chitinophaga sp. YIM B06452]|uniref:pepsin-like aspartyl protease n=1 Tax=Chitinophaga sp. YIM B06452 TaxID=3082158 RepID=UPI0031FEF56F